MLRRLISALQRPALPLHGVEHDPSLLRFIEARQQTDDAGLAEPVCPTRAMVCPARSGTRRAGPIDRAAWCRSGTRSFEGDIAPKRRQRFGGRGIPDLRFGVQESKIRSALAAADNIALYKSPIVWMGPKNSPR